MNEQADRTVLVPVADLVSTCERAKFQAFRNLVYACAPSMPEDVQAVMRAWHEANGVLIPWLRAVGGAENNAEADRLEQATVRAPD